MEHVFSGAAPASPNAFVISDSTTVPNAQFGPEVREAIGAVALVTDSSRLLTPRFQPTIPRVEESCERDTSSFCCNQRTHSSETNDSLGSKLTDSTSVAQRDSGNQHWSAVSRSTNLPFAVLSGLTSLCEAEIADECARRRSRLRSAHGVVDKVLDESEEAIKLKPSKSDKLTAQEYHSCFRHLHWSLGHCLQMQELAQRLENYDSGCFSGGDVSDDYANLSIEICLRHDRALRLLMELRRNGDKEEQQMTIVSVESVTQPVNDAFQVWLNSILVGCSSRKCLSSTSCTGARAKSEESSDPVPDALAFGMGLLSLFGWPSQPLSKR